LGVSARPECGRLLELIVRDPISSTAVVASPFARFWRFAIMRAPSRAFAIALLLAPVGADAQTSGPAGVWLTQKGDAHVRIAPCGGALCGTIVWLKDPIDSETRRPVADTHNPDPGRRNRPIMGLQIMFGMKPSGPDRWSGHFYNSDDGKTYEGNLVLLGPNAVKAEGCLLAICMGETWQRVEGAKPGAKSRRKA
jgi:uncharacterized protein (DUF2147 family)